MTDLNDGRMAAHYAGLPDEELLRDYRPGGVRSCGSNSLASYPTRNRKTRPQIRYGALDAGT
jgi:hypothetical protein